MNKLASLEKLASLPDWAVTWDSKEPPEGYEVVTLMTYPPKKILQKKPRDMMPSGRGNPVIMPSTSMDRGMPGEYPGKKYYPDFYAEPTESPIMKYLPKEMRKNFKDSTAFPKNSPFGTTSTMPRFKLKSMTNYLRPLSLNEATR